MNLATKRKIAHELRQANVESYGSRTKVVNHKADNNVTILTRLATYTVINIASTVAKNNNALIYIDIYRLKSDTLEIVIHQG